jgi:hypothetical protein
MNFAIDTKTPPKPKDDSASQTAQAADLLLTHSLLASEHVESSSVKTNKHGVTVRVERVLRTKTAVYIHYRVENLSQQPYRVITPSVFVLSAPKATVSLPSLVNVQLNERMISRLGRTEQNAVEVSNAQVQHEETEKGSEVKGVVVIRPELASPAVLELRFGSDGSRSVKATVVL